jgi:predicted dehydrogenase
MDLMIHDIDLILELVDVPVERVDASGASVLTSHIDIANARIQFANGCVANVTASRISQKSERRMRLFQPNAYFSVDFGNRSLDIRRKGDQEMLPGIPDIQSETLALPDRDALAEEIRSFVDAVQTGSAPVVSGRDGLRALKTATEITRQLEANRLTRQQWASANSNRSQQ